MAKTKISEFSANPANNTDIDSINIAEGCAPSGINDAIRELMAQLKDWQSGTSNDPYVVGSSGSLTLNQGTANGVPYLNGSKVVTSGSALVFDGSNLGVGVTPSAWSGYKALQVNNGAFANSSGTTLVGWNSYYDGSNYRYIVTGQASQMLISPTGGGGFAWFNAASGTAGNAISFTQAMTLDASGNLGIGTSSPGGKLEVNQGKLIIKTSDQSLSRLQIANTGASGQTFEIVAGDVGTSNTGLSFYDVTNSATRMRINSSGNVGIGTNSPLTKLHVQSSDVAFTPDTNADFLIVENNGTSAIQIVASTTGKSELFFSDTTRNIGGYSYDHTNNFLATIVNGSERARIDSSGNLLVGATGVIGTTSRLSADGGAGSAGIFRTNGNTECVQIFNQANGSFTPLRFLVNNFATAVGSVSCSTTATAYNTSSDYRLKEDIAPMTGALAKVAALKPVTYKWKSDGSDGEGFIAHELQAVVPQCVTGEKDAVDAEGKPQYQGIDTSFLVATLTAAIQELKAEFDAYKSTHP
jgi:hypothetical protein